mgnify:CR=1 FL=1
MTKACKNVSVTPETKKLLRRFAWENDEKLFEVVERLVNQELQRTVKKAAGHGDTDR